MNRRFRQWVTVGAAATELVSAGRLNAQVPPGRIVAVIGGGQAVELDQVRAIAIHRGLLYVTQSKETAVLVLTTGGNTVRHIGRPGSGPGEFRAVSALGFVGDSLWVFDGILHRLSYFTSSGSLVSTRTVASSQRRGFGPPAVVSVSAKGELLMVPSIIGPTPATFPRTMPVIVRRPDETEVDVAAAAVTRSILMLPRGGVLVNQLFRRFFDGTDIIRADATSIRIISRDVVSPQLVDCNSDRIDTNPVSRIGVMPDKRMARLVVRLDVGHELPP